MSNQGYYGGPQNPSYPPQRSAICGDEARKCVLTIASVMDLPKAAATLPKAAILPKGILLRVILLKFVTSPARSSDKTTIVLESAH